MKSIAIRPLEPPYFGLRPMATIDVFGTDEVWLAPLPSTILGVLGVINGITNLGCNDTSNVIERTKISLDKLIELKDKIEIDMLWGPIIEVEGENGRCNKCYPLVGNECVCSDGRIIKLRIISKVGIELSDSKTAHLGRFFKTRYIMPKNIIYKFIVKGNLKDGNYVVRVGGESRMSLVKVESISIDEMHDEFGVESIEKVSGYVIALSPVFVNPDKIEEIGFKRLEPEDIDDCVSVIVGLVSCCPLSFKPKVVQWGLGFSEVCGERRPMYPALPPGTILKVNGCKPNIGFLSDLGYGSIAPINKDAFGVVEVNLPEMEYFEG